MDSKDTEHARQQAQWQLEGIREMLAALNVDYSQLEELQDERKRLQGEVFDAIAAVDAGENDDSCGALGAAEEELYQFGRDYGEGLTELEAAAGNCESRDDAYDRIQEDPLSVEVRSGWHAPGVEDVAPDEFQILLGTGGPAVRIRGELDGYCTPCRAWLEYQDWFTPWVEYHEDGDQEVLLEYAQQFYFGG